MPHRKPEAKEAAAGDRRKVPESVEEVRAGEEAAVAFGRWLFAQDCRFVTAAVETDALPPEDLPEVAFAGRSNVGKSSLLNALTGRSRLARTSRSPGRTQQINFFALGGRLMLVDLPGYGFARAPKRAVRAWIRLVEAYLSERPNLSRLCLLIDARMGLKDSDRDLMAKLDCAAVPYQIVLTKADKVPAREMAARLAALEQELSGHPAALRDLKVTSARRRLGIDGLRASLAALVADAGRD
jgi:GTP-binding protein